MSFALQILLKAGSSVPTRSRSRAVLGLGCALVLASSTLTGCTMTAGAAVIIDGNPISESSLQHDVAAFTAKNMTTAMAPAQTASFNRAQITYQVRHALIGKAVAAQKIVITQDQLTAAKTQIAAQGAAGLALQLDLPASVEADVVFDALALTALIKALPAAGVPVENISVRAEGVSVTTRDQAVALRSKALDNPAVLDGAVAAAGQTALPKQVYKLLQTPGAGAVGLYQSRTQAVVIFPNSSGYLVLRTSDRMVQQVNLTASNFSSITQLSEVFDVASLLLAPYQGEAAISVNPRYGVWDPATLQVIPSNSGL